MQQLACRGAERVRMWMQVAKNLGVITSELFLLAERELSTKE